MAYLQFPPTVSCPGLVNEALEFFLGRVVLVQFLCVPMKFIDEGRIQEELGTPIPER